MNINYHYFTVKTLSRKAGFSEEEAQEIAYYSQQIDDFILYTPLFLENAPPQFFIDNSLAKKEENIWVFLPCTTGISVVFSVIPLVQRQTLLPFHFISASSIPSGKFPDASECRCVNADQDPNALINQLLQDIIKSAIKERESSKEGLSSKTLMSIGMILHTFADTYSHHNYSGLDGWANRTLIKKAFDQRTQKEMDDLLKYFYQNVSPSIGHENAGHVPDICSFDITLELYGTADGKKVISDTRNNDQLFLGCSRHIIDALCSIFGTSSISDAEWNNFSKRLASAQYVDEENDSDKLSEHWKNVFPEYEYSYDKRTEFKIEFLDKEADNSLLTDHKLSKDDLFDIYHELGSSARNKLSITARNVPVSFFDYNELAYRHVYSVIGSYRAVETFPESPAPISADGWKPETTFGYLVVTAGFEYDPQQDIIYSTMYNVQRSLGYCELYDQSSVMMACIIDSEPIYFTYGMYDWMIELWKGQYGIETGAEIGIYRRKKDKSLGFIEKYITGKMFDCVPDDARMNMTLQLFKGDKLILHREALHWWLTGFQWGLINEPEDVRMKGSLEFPNQEMLDLFKAAMEKMNYNPEISGLVVSFEFNKPYSEQPKSRECARKFIFPLDVKMVNSYNEMKLKLNIHSNDPNEIDRAIIKTEDAEARALYKRLCDYFRSYRNSAEWKKHVSNPTMISQVFMRLKSIVHGQKEKMSSDWLIKAANEFAEKKRKGV
jgi:hypothetical protein